MRTLRALRPLRAMARMQGMRVRYIPLPISFPARVISTVVDLSIVIYCTYCSRTDYFSTQYKNIESTVGS